MDSSRDNISNPIVSVCTQTYQHVPYIRNTLDSILMQKTDFPFEILLGEDESTDGTREICIEYGEKYHDKIRLFLNSRRNVIYVDGRPTGRWNFMNNLRNARGKYIAMMPGDDYWTDSYKLQKQVDFLERHPDCAMCFHNAYNLRPDQSKVDYMREWFKVEIKPYYTLEDLLTQNFIPTCSVLFRNGLIKEFPNQYYKILAGDWLLHVMLARFGRLGFINEIWGVRRIHEGGLMSKASKEDRLSINIECLEIIDSYLGLYYEKVIKPQIYLYSYRLAVSYATRGDLRNARACSKKCITEMRHKRQLSNRKFFAMLLMVYVPSLYNLLGLLREVIRDRKSD